MTTEQLWKYGMVKGRFRSLWKGWQPQIWDNFWRTSAVGLNSVCNTFAVVSQRNIQMDLLMIGNQPVEYDKTTINLQMWNLIINREQQMCFCLKSPRTRSTRCQLWSRSQMVYGLYDHMSLGKGLVSYSHKPIPLTGVR